MTKKDSSSQKSNTTTMRNIFCGIILSWVLIIFCERSQAQIPGQEWANRTGERLKSFLPKPIASLQDRMPWDIHDFNHPRTTGVVGGESPGPLPNYYPVSAIQQWRFADPDLVQQYKKTKSAEGRAVDQTVKHLKQTEAQQKEREKRLVALSKRQAELSMQGKYDEVDKLQKEIDRLVAEGDKEATRFHDPESLEKIKRKARTLEISIGANEDSPSDQKTGRALKGYQVYRNQRDGSNVRVSAYIGPAGFKNTVLDKKMQSKIKSILVRVTAYSTPESLKADEAVAWQMIERVDLAGLAKMIEK